MFLLLLLFVFFLFVCLLGGFLNLFLLSKAICFLEHINGIGEHSKTPPIDKKKDGGR